MAHCMVGGGAFDDLGNLRKCAYICPEKFVRDYQHPEVKRTINSGVISKKKVIA